MECYHDILLMVVEGIPICKALETKGIHRSTFYRGLTEDQKQELNYYRAACNKGSDFISYKLGQIFKPHFYYMLDEVCS